MADQLLKNVAPEVETEEAMEKNEKPYKNEEKFLIPVNFFGLLILKDQTLKALEEENNVKMVILSSGQDEAIPEGQPRKKILQINGEPKNVEKAVAVVENILKDAKIRLQRILSSNSKSFDDGDSKFECPICYGTYDIVIDGCITCLPFLTESSSSSQIDLKEFHSICVNCIQDYARSAITGRVAPGGLGLNCVVEKCSNVFLLTSFEKYLTDEIRKPFLTRLQEQCLLDTNLKDLVTCPECGYKVCIPPTDTFYVCECGRRQCRSCPRLYDEKHYGKSCKQMAEEEARNTSSQKPETKMSEIVVRKCHRCGTQFIKSDACNLMESCPCGAKQCYICNEPDVTYAHFCRCEGSTVKHGPCPQCGKTCRQYENDQELDDIRLAEFQRQNGVRINLPHPEDFPSTNNPTPRRQPVQRIVFNNAEDLMAEAARRSLQKIRTAPTYDPNHNNQFLRGVETAMEQILQNYNPQL